MKNKSYVLIANFHSRQAKDAVDEIKTIFRSKKAELKILEVNDTSKMNEYFQKAIDDKPDVIVLGGGDGTLISGIEFLTNKKYNKPIGLLPLGTANYLARNLSIPLTVKESVETLLKGRTKSMPVGVANDKFFALSLLIGLTQAAAENVSDKHKHKWGQLAYIFEIVRQTKNHDPFDYSIVSPELKKPVKGTTHQIMVYNSDLNQQVKIVPDHTLKKHTLKVVINRCGKSMFKFYCSFIVHAITFGKLRPYMRVFEVKSLEIETTPSLRADYDGEPYGKSPFHIALLDHDIKVIC